MGPFQAMTEVFWDEVAFYESHLSPAYWVDSGVSDASAGTNIQIRGEVLTSSSNQGQECSGLSTGTYYNVTINWDSSGQGWLFKPYGVSGCNAWLYVESVGSDSINGNGGYEFLESDDSVSSDFNSMGAYVVSDYSLHYDTSSSGGSWSSPVWLSPVEQSSPPSTVGVEYSCSGPFEAIDSAYSPPWSAGSTPTWACT
jgi:hypothetical protein